MSNRKKVGQTYQNKFKYKNFAESKLTKRVNKTPLDLCCQRCYDQIKWKMDYGKYKPLSQPGKCVDCGKKNITKAYRALCDTCAQKKVEIRVQKLEAEELGLIRKPEEPQAAQPATDDAAVEEQKTVAE